MAQALIIRSPAALPPRDSRPWIFLAGSIDNGAAEPWQSQLEANLAPLPVIILNPRRTQWPVEAAQTATNPLFHEQVLWELRAMEQASLIALYFAPGSQAPISLLECGLYARSGKLVVACPEGFWRKGNLEIVCAYYDIPLLHSLAALSDQLVARFRP